MVEEVDETEFWLELIKDACLTQNQEVLENLLKESLELIKIMSKAKSSSYN